MKKHLGIHMESKRTLASLSLTSLTGVLLFAACAWAASPRTVVLYKFTGGADGRSPNGQFIADGAGNLYGTTELGGMADNGVVFELSPPTVKGGKWKQTVLYSFTGGSDGLAPNPGLVFDGEGNLYGTT